MSALRDLATLEPPHGDGENQKRTGEQYQTARLGNTGCSYRQIIPDARGLERRGRTIARIVNELG